MNQPWVYLCPLPLEPPFHLPPPFKEGSWKANHHNMAAWNKQGIGQLAATADVLMLLVCLWVYLWWASPLQADSSQLRCWVAALLSGVSIMRTSPFGAEQHGSAGSDAGGWPLPGTGFNQWRTGVRRQMSSFPFSLWNFLRHIILVSSGYPRGLEPQQKLLHTTPFIDFPLSSPISSLLPNLWSLGSPPE